MLAVALTVGEASAESVEGQYIYAVAPLRFMQKYYGDALQREAFRHTDLLPFYGSSELEIGDPFHVSTVFRLYPTGFTVFPIGGAGAEPLIYLQRLAAAGGDLRGKKVIISLSPQFFTEPSYWSNAYDTNFSRLDAYEFAFSDKFSFALKQGVAQRMLDYGETLAQDPFLNLSLKALADRSTLSNGLYFALLPLGKLQVLILQLQDHWATVDFIQSQDHLDPVVPRRGARLNWQTLLAHADQAYMQRSDSNPFGFENSQWQKSGVDWMQAKGSLTDEQFLAALKRSEGWSDLALLLEGLKDAGAQPLVLSMPLPGNYLDYVGVSAAARQVYYKRLSDLVESYGMPLQDFQAFDDDRYFLWNPNGHLSSRGWIFYAQAIDAFYHDLPLAINSDSR
jgi:D-alanine transfer protein